MRLDCSM